MTARRRFNPLFAPSAALLAASVIAGCGSGSASGTGSGENESLRAPEEVVRRAGSDPSPRDPIDAREGRRERGDESRNEASRTGTGNAAATSSSGGIEPGFQDAGDGRPARQPSPRPVFRASDNRPRHDDRRLAAVGIRAFESKRLKLYTDVDPTKAVKLPALIDAAYTAWEKYFGRLPPNRERTEFQITAYLMADRARFRDAGLIPRDLRPFADGRHRGAELWMDDQQFDYYRRHLLVHEATHCFMEAVAGARYYEDLPIWYWEGMAELFGTHHVGDDGQVRFRVMPADRQDFAGLGRITIVYDAVQQGEAKSLADVTRLRSGDYLEPDAYAWSWALCKFLDTHPRYRKPFRDLGQLLTGSRFRRAFRDLLAAHDRELAAEWPMFVSGLQYGYDVERAAIDFQPGRPLAPGERSSDVEVVADRGWQSSGVHVERGATYSITAHGRFTMAEHPKPWVSEPGGISFDYFHGRPLGLLLATIHVDGKRFTPEMPIGAARRFTASKTGTLYFRLNDSWSRLADNSGKVRIDVERVAEE